MSELIRVLHIDDLAADRELVNDALEREHGGFEVVQAASREELESRLTEGEYDVVLSDFNILDFEGLDVIDLMRERAPDVPVIIVTGTGSETIAVEAMKRGAADYVIKTLIHIQRLPLTIQAALDKAHLQAEHERVEAERERLLHDTGKRVKELRCMYGVAESIRTRETLEQVFEDVVALMPPSWQYPEITRGRIRLDDREWVSQPFENTEWRQNADITVAGKLRGTVEVFYLEECLELDEGPFLKEERDLIDGIALALSRAVEHDQADKERERFTHAIEQAAEAIVITDAEATIQYVNPAFEQITGYTCEEAIGQNPRILKSGRQDDAFYKDMWDTLKRGDVWKGRFVNKRKDSVFYTEEATISPVRDSSGRTVNYVAVKRDITEELRLEEQLRQAQKMEAIGHLAGGIAHDFRNQLTVVKWGAERLLRKRLVSEDGREDVEEIIKAANASKVLTDQLLAFSRKEMLRAEIVDLAKVAGELGGSMPAMIGEDIAVSVIPRVEPSMAKVDPGQLRQAVVNLIVNARDAMPSGGELTIWTGDVHLPAKAGGARGVAPGRYATLSVSDTGIGMDAETKVHIFDPFYTTKEVGKGTGMGLAMVHGFVAQSGGFIEVDSEPDKGSTFRLHFPWAVGPVPAAQRQPEAAQMVGGNETILVVEDEEALRRMIESMLKELGYTVLTARDPVDAQSVVAGHTGPLDALVTDVVMPRGSGTDLAAQMRRHRPGIAVMYISGYGGDDLVRRGLGELEGALLRKPFTAEALARSLRGALGGVGTPGSGHA